MKPTHIIKIAQYNGCRTAKEMAKWIKDNRIKWSFNHIVMRFYADNYTVIPEEE